MKIIDNFLEESDFKYIQEVMSNHQFPWYYHDKIDSVVQETDNFQFCHGFYSANKGFHGDYHELLHPILGKLNAQYVLKAKANLNVRGDGSMIGDYHIDVDVESAKTAIFYVTTNNGYTLLETGEKIESIANRIVIFDSDIKHTGFSATDSKTRILININFIGERDSPQPVHLAAQQGDNPAMITT